MYHELGARMGIVTGKGLLALVRERRGPRGATVALGALVLANLGTLAAEFAGVAAGFELLGGVSRYISVPLAALGVSLLVLRGSFHRVEHVLLALTGVFVAYILSGCLAHPDWTATAKGLIVPGMPLTREAVLVAVATLGTTLAPWDLAFIQSYVVDKRLKVKDLRNGHEGVAAVDAIKATESFETHRLSADSGEPVPHTQRRGLRPLRRGLAPAAL